MTDPDPPVGEDELQAWVDARLPPDRAQTVEDWLGRNPAEAARIAQYRAQRDELRVRLAPRYDQPVPPYLRAAEIQARRRDVFRRRLANAAAGFVLMLAGGAAGWLARGAAPGAPALLAAEAVDAHKLFVTEVRHPVEVPAAQEAHLVQWLSNRLGRKLRVPDLAPLGFRLMGGRLLPGDGVPAAQFMYEDGGGARLTLYMRAEPGDSGTGFELVDRGGVTGFRWMEGGFGYAVLAEAGRERLLPVAEAVHRQLTPRE